MMKRFQILLSTVQWDWLTALAESTGLSIAEHIRRAIDEYRSRLEVK